MSHTDDTTRVCTIEYKIEIRSIPNYQRLCYKIEQHYTVISAKAFQLIMVYNISQTN